MEQLCYETLEKAGYTGYLLKNAPERVLQFGEGKFPSPNCSTRSGAFFSR